MPPIQCENVSVPFQTVPCPSVLYQSLLASLFHIKVYLAPLFRIRAYLAPLFRIALI